MFLLTVGVAALLVAGAQGSDSAARNAVSTPRPSSTANTNNAQAAQSNRNATANTSQQTNVNSTDTVGAASSARQPK